MNWIFRLAGQLSALFALLMLVFDGFGNSLTQEDVWRLGSLAIGGSLLALASRRGNAPWESFGNVSQGNFNISSGISGPEKADIAKHAITEAMRAKQGQAKQGDA